MKKFIVAFNGIYQAFKSEFSLKFQLVVAIFIVFSGVFFNLCKVEWMLVILCIAGVISAELFNTAIEKLCDKVEPNYDKKIGLIKDISAGAVLITAIASFFVGLIIFLPKVSSLIYCSNAF